MELYDPMVGEVLDGRYRIVARLGESASSLFYVAVHELLDRRVQIRLLRPELATDVDLGRRLLARARAEARLAHPNVLRVLDSGYTRDRGPYVVSEHVTGNPLSSLLREEAPFEPARAMELAAQMCAGLGAAHAAGLTHGNLSPETVLVVKDDSAELAKLTCFSGPLYAQRGLRTGTGFLEGEPEFMTPEHASGQPLGPASDIYSLGVLLYAMVTGRVPFSEDSFTRTLWAHLKAPVPDPRIFRPDLPDPLRRILATALAKDPRSRYASAEAFEQELRRAMQRGRGSQVAGVDSPPRARPGPPAPQSGAPGGTASGGRTTDRAEAEQGGRRHSRKLSGPFLMGIGATVGLGLLVGLLSYLVRQRFSRRPPATSTAPMAPRGRRQEAEVRSLRPSTCCRGSAPLVVHTQPPGASISLDGRFLGTSPLEIEASCSERPARIRAEKEGFVPEEVDSPICGRVRLLLHLRREARVRPSSRQSKHHGKKAMPRARAGNGGVFKTPPDW